nr:hypothetical protein [Tanacetum cinerariifolium]
MDEGDDGDDDDGDSSGDDADDEDEDEEDEEEEEHLASDNSTVVIPTDELVSLRGGTEPVMPPPSTDTTTTGARITVRLQAAISFSQETEVERLLSMPTPSPSLLASLSPPSTGERLARCTSPAALPSLPPLHMPPPVDHKDDIFETEIPPRKRLCLSTLGFRNEVGESSTARPAGGRGIDYGFVSTLDAEARRRGIGEVGYAGRLTYGGQDSPPGDHTDYGGGSLCCMRGLGSLDRIESAELLALREKPRRARQPIGDARVPNHQDAPRDVDRTEGVVGLTQLVEKTELVFQINGCAIENQIQKQLKKANTTLAQELKECKAILAKTSKSLGESISVRDSCLVAFQTKQTEFEKYKAFNDRTIDYDKLQ